MTSGPLMCAARTVQPEPETRGPEWHVHKCGRAARRMRNASGARVDRLRVGYEQSVQPCVDAPGFGGTHQCAEVEPEGRVQGVEEGKFPIGQAERERISDCPARPEAASRKGHAALRQPAAQRGSDLPDGLRRRGQVHDPLTVRGREFARRQIPIQIEVRRAPARLRHCIRSRRTTLVRGRVEARQQRLVPELPAEPVLQHGKTARHQRRRERGAGKALLPPAGTGEAAREGIGRVLGAVIGHRNVDTRRGDAPWRRDTAAVRERRQLAVAARRNHRDDMAP